MLPIADHPTDFEEGFFTPQAGQLEELLEGYPLAVRIVSSVGQLRKHLERPPECPEVLLVQVDEKSSRSRQRTGYTGPSGNWSSIWLTPKKKGGVREHESPQYNDDLVENHPAGDPPCRVCASLARHRSGSSWEYEVSAAAWLALLCAVCIQIVVNLHNDKEDFIRGADTDERVGQARAAQQGWLTPRDLNLAIAGVAGIALAGAIALTYLAGWVVLGIAAISRERVRLHGRALPLAYNGLGDLFVFLFFGLVAVTGTTPRGDRAMGPARIACGSPVRVPGDRHSGGEQHSRRPHGPQSRKENTRGSMGAVLRES